MTYETFKGGHRAVIKRNGETLFCLHETVIVAKLNDGAIELSTGGWNTVTTWKYMGIALRCLGSSIVFVRDKEGKKFVHYMDTTTPFKDGMILGRVPLADMTITLIDNDVGGNRRVVVHFLNLLTEKEKATPDALGSHARFGAAMARARRAWPGGAFVYRSKKYGGGIGFTNIDDDKLRRLIAQHLDIDEQQGM